VLLHGRSRERGEAALAQVPGARLYLADLASLDEVRRLADDVLAHEDRLDVLCNNAGLGSGSRDATRRESADGLELLFAVNYLAHFLLTLRLLDLLRRSAPARIVNVASAGQQALDFDDPQLERGWSGARAFLLVGEEDWPFPVPLVQRGTKWFFDSKAGVQELLYRRIGANELDAIEVCRGYVEAQHEYALIKRGTSGVNQYAQRIISTPGKQDGLAWQKADGTWDGPIGEKVAQAIARGYSSRSEPFHGYYFRVLKGQGPAAPLGELDFVVKDVMIGGFALIAFPAQYRVTGVQTFMVSHDGVVYQKDLGPKTLELAGAIDRFNPDKSWTPVLEK